jgi:hypothetical protein
MRRKGMLRPDDEMLVDLAAARLLACCSRQAGPEAQADFRAAFDRLLARRGGHVVVQGQIFVCMETLREALRAVTGVALERFEAALLPKFAGTEKAVVERALGETLQELEAATERMLSELCMLH